MNTINIYALVDPRNDHVKYIGQCTDVKTRFKDHLKKNRSAVYKNWIASLRSVSIRPSIEVLDIVPENEWGFWERHYISLYRSWGFNLENKTLGGGGALGHYTVHTEETKKRWSEIRRGRKVDPSITEKNREKGYYEETKIRMSGNGNPAKKTRKPINQYDMSGTLIKEWDCGEDAANELGLFAGDISRVARGIRSKSCGGFIWKYRIEPIQS